MFLFKIQKGPVSCVIMVYLILLKCLFSPFKLKTLPGLSKSCILYCMFSDWSSSIKLLSTYRYTAIFLCWFPEAQIQLLEYSKRWHPNQWWKMSLALQTAVVEAGRFLDMCWGTWKLSCYLNSCSSCTEISHFFCHLVNNVRSGTLERKKGQCCLSLKDTTDLWRTLLSPSFRTPQSWSDTQPLELRNAVGQDFLKTEL